MTDSRRVVIVGGGIAGWTVASTLRAGGFDGTLLVIEREPACYDRPPLSKAALIGGTPLAELAFADSATLADARIDVRTGRTVMHVDAAALELQLNDGSTVAGDIIVLASGVSARPPTFRGGDLPGILTLRTYADAVALRALAGRSVAVLGAGLIGAEATAALRTLGSDVTLIDPNEMPGVRVFGPTLAQYLHAMHTAHGVDLRTDTVEAVNAANGRLHVVLGSGGTVEVDGVLVATGITLDTALAANAGLDVDGGIMVDDAGRTSVPGIFAAGDATRRRLPGGALGPVRGHWEAAQRDGQAVAAAILGNEPAPVGADWFWSDRYGHHIEVAGDVSSTGREVVREGAQPTIFRVDGDRLVGAASVDDPNTVRAARRLIDRAVSVSVDQLTDPHVPVRSLLPRG